MEFVLYRKEFICYITSMPYFFLLLFAFQDWAEFCEDTAFFETQASFSRSFKVFLLINKINKKPHHPKW